LEQAQNKRNTVLLTLNGRTLSISAWERELNMTSGTLKRRLQRGWSHVRALTAPVR
jgi:trehalose/maltose hydrolase-like predicted phosphorylase